MRRHPLASLAFVAAFLAGAVGTAAAAPSGPVAQQCAAIDTTLAKACYGADVAGRDAAAVLTPQQATAAVDAYEHSATHRALALQYALGDDVPLRNAPWIGTHNSFNSIAEMGPTLSDLDANQQLSLTDQLRADVRSLELDVHWFPSASASGARAPVVCHAQGDHSGCSAERTLGPVLDEIATWLHGHRDQVLLLYVEDHLDGQDGHDAGAATIRRSLGSLLYAPKAGTGCVQVPMDLSRDDVLTAHKQVVIVGDCGTGAAYQATAFAWSAHVEGGPVGFQDFPRCGPDYPRATYDATLVRYYEDSTWLSAGASAAGAASEDDGITPATAAALARCGVDLVGLDQLAPGDGRLDALLWSWAPGEPAAKGDCAVQRGDGRWAARSCAERHRAACRRGDGPWTLTRSAVSERSASAACRREHATFAVPRTGYENALLHSAAGSGETWLGHERAGARWRTLDRR